MRAVRAAQLQKIIEDVFNEIGNANGAADEVCKRIKKKYGMSEDRYGLKGESEEVLQLDPIPAMEMFDLAAELYFERRLNDMAEEKRKRESYVRVPRTKA
jgi:hypothetical protein